MSTSEKSAGGAYLAIGGTRLLFAPEDVEATARRLEDVADNLGLALASQREALAGRPAGAETVSQLAVDRLEASAASLDERISAASDQLIAAAANLRMNGEAYVRSDAHAIYT